MKCNLIKYIFFFLFSFLFLLPGGAMAEPIAVIVNAANPVNSLSISDIKKYYENDLVAWSDGSRVILYDLPVKVEGRKFFSEKVLGKMPAEIAREWANRKITNTAKNPPITLILDLLVQKRVGMAKGAIGYLPKMKVNSNKVKIVAVLE